MTQKHARDMTDAEFAAAKSVVIGNEHSVRAVTESERELAALMRSKSASMAPEQVKARIAFELAEQEKPTGQ